MNWNTFSNAKKKPKVVRGDKLLESLRDLGEGVADSVAREVVGGIATEALDQITGRTAGELKPNQSLDLSQLPPKEEAERKERQYPYFQQEFLDLRHQEKMVWKRAEQDTRLEISAILQELQQIAKSTEKLSQEVEIAAMQVPVEPGVYHLSFFEKLRQALEFFRKSLQESATWLGAFNRKAKKRNYYWAQVKKSGTKFMLSQERYMATQAG